MTTTEVSKKPKVILLIIDPQVDFHPGGSLAIANANDDSERTASLILNNIDHIDDIVVTLDTHHVSFFICQSINICRSIYFYLYY